MVTCEQDLMQSLLTPTLQDVYRQWALLSQSSAGHSDDCKTA